MAGIDGSGAAGAHPPPPSPPAYPSPSSPRLGRTPKEGERILAPTRRPDGTLRKPIRIRAGYVPQDEVAIYQSKGARLKKSAEEQLPPGYDPTLDAKPKTKSAKRNERRKEKKLQAALAASGGKGKSLDANEGQHAENEQDSSTYPSAERVEPLESVTSELNKLSVSSTYSIVAGDQSESSNPDNPPESSNPESSPSVILDKKIRAIKKKDKITGRAIGRGCKEGGVYRLSQNLVDVVCHGEVSFSVGSPFQWYLHLDHLPLDRLRCVIPHISSSAVITCGVSYEE